MRALNIRHTAIVTEDLHLALYFYGDLLGMNRVKKSNLKGSWLNTLLGEREVDLTYVKLACDEKSTCLLELYYFNKPELELWDKIGKAFNSFNHLAFTVDNIDSLYRKLIKKGIKFKSKPLLDEEGKNKLAFCEDYDGNLIELVQEMK